MIPNVARVSTERIAFYPVYREHTTVAEAGQAFLGGYMATGASVFMVRTI